MTVSRALLFDTANKPVHGTIGLKKMCFLSAATSRELTGSGSGHDDRNTGSWFTQRRNEVQILN